MIDDVGVIDAVKDELKCATLHGLRDRLGALATFCEVVAGLTDEEADYLADMLTPYTDAVLHELARREQGVDYRPYPHPIGEGPMDHA